MDGSSSTQARALSRPLVAVGLLLIVVAWFTPWLTPAAFGGFFRMEVHYWGLSVTAGEDSEFESWFSSEWDDFEGIGWGRLGVVLGALGWLGALVYAVLPWLGDGDRRGRLRREGPALATASSAALLLGFGIVTYAIVAAFDGEVGASDWQAGFWVAWIGVTLVSSGAALAWRGQPPASARPVGPDGPGRPHEPERPGHPAGHTPPDPPSDPPPHGSRD